MHLQNSIYSFETVTAYKDIIHGISTKSFGSMRLNDAYFDKSLKKFADTLSIDSNKIVLMEQVHGDSVAWVGENDTNKIIKATDALLTDVPGIFLAVRTADCMPIILFDTVKRYVGVVHAGWRGLYNRIIEKTITKMVARGSNAKNIVAAIGPCIQSCCFEVGKDVSDKFVKKFKGIYKNFTPTIIHKHDRVYINQPFFAKQQLIYAGIAVDAIEDSGICTKDSPDIFFSYRGEGAEKFGVFTSIIGLKK